MSTKNDSDDMRDEYDFSGGERGKYVERLRAGSHLVVHDARAKEISFSDDEMTLFLADGRRLSVPLAWFPRLLRAPAPQRENYELLGGGVGIHWPDLDEDLNVADLLRAGSE